MRPRHRRLAGLAMALVVGFGMGRLLWLRYEQGDVYPPYSTLRPDPLGSKALYATFDSLSGVEARRWIHDLDEHPPPEKSTLWFAGATPRSIRWQPRSEWIKDQNWIKQGGRLVITLSPVDKAAGWDLFAADLKVGSEKKRLKKKAEKKKRDEAKKKYRKKAAKKEDKDNSAKDKKKDDEKKKENPPDDPWWEIDPEKIRRQGWHQLWWEWGMEFDFQELDRDGAGYLEDNHAWLENENLPLPQKLMTRTGLRLVPFKKGWKALYTRRGQWVAAWRSLGAGEIVLWADGYWLSNEALRRHRPSRLLAWLQGGRPLAVFDERHHGIASRPGIADLIRRLGLQAAVLALLASALLFLWRAMSPLVPPPLSPVDGEPEVQSREDAAAGLARLLRRSLKPAVLLSQILDEWKKMAGPSSAAGTQRAAKAEKRVRKALREENEEGLIQAYSDAAQTLKRRKP